MAQERGYQADTARRQSQVEPPVPAAPCDAPARSTYELTEADLALVGGGTVDPNDPVGGVKRSKESQ